MAEIPGGYILLARKILTSGIMDKPPLYLKIWMYCLLKATKKPYGDLMPGQFRASIADIQEATSYYVGARKQVPSIKQIRRAMAWLCGSTESPPKGIAKGIAKGVRKMLITIYNYEHYQTPSHYEGRNEGHNEKHAKGQQGASVVCSSDSLRKKWEKLVVEMRRGNGSDQKTTFKNCTSCGRLIVSTAKYCKKCKGKQ